MPNFLPDSFVQSYASKPLHFGGNGLGEIVYRRTYSRLVEEEKKERWFQTVARAVNGAQEIDAGYSLDEAMRLYDYQYRLKGSLAGRALWQLGTSMVTRFGAPSLCNCWYLSLDEVESFEQVMYLLMTGGGVGFSVERSVVHNLPKVKQYVRIKHERTNDADVIVPDSREGWVRLLHSVLKSYFETGRSFSYSTILVRSYGAPLKTFGGTASGPEILIEGITEISRILEARAGKKIRSIDALDICNIIGKVVVAGNARRSAQIAIGDPDDYLFLKAKRWNSMTIPDYRQNSNNSVYADSYEEIIDEFWKNFDGNSEPYGLVNRKLAQTQGRIGEECADPLAHGMNPCFRGDQLFLTSEGWRRFDEMVGQEPVIIQDRRVIGFKTGEGEDWSVTPKLGGTELNKASHVRVTARNKEVWKLITTCGREIVATPDHAFATERGMRELKDLSSNDRLLVTVPNVPWINFESGNFDLGYVAGLWASDGTTTDHQVIIDLWFNELDESIKTECARIHGHIKRAISIVADLDSAFMTSDGSRPIAEIPAIQTQSCVRPFVKRRIASTPLKRFFDSIGASKTSLSWLHKQTKEFKSGFISGFFYGDGTVLASSKQRNSLRIAQSDKGILAVLQLILQELGVTSTSRLVRDKGEKEMPDGRGEKKLYLVKSSYELIVSSREMIRRFADVTRVGHDKQERIANILGNYSRPTYNKAFATGVKHVVPLVDKVDVYCLKEDQRRTVVVGGVAARRCGEIFLEPGESCNLAEIFLPRIESKEELIDVARLLYKTQKAITSLPYPFKKSEEIVRRNRRLGLGITGWLQASPAQLSWVKDAYKALQAFDVEWSKKLGIPASIKLTAVKPSGTLSLLPFVTPGVHPAFDQYFIRRVRIGSNDPLVGWCRESGYAVQYDVMIDGSSDYRTCVVDFPCSYPETTVFAKNTTAVDQLNWVVKAQTDWSDNAVSVSVYYRPEEIPSIREWLKDNYEHKIKSVSFILHEDHGFALPPYESINKDQYEKMLTKVKPVDTDVDGGMLELGCDGGACPIR